MADNNIKKIVVLGPDYFLPPEKNGVNKTTYNIVRALEQSEVTFLYPSMDPAHKKKRCDLKHVKVNDIKINKNFLPPKFKKLFSLLSPRPYICEPQARSKAIAYKLERDFSDQERIVIMGLQYAQVLEFLSESLRQKSILIPIDCLTLFYQTRLKQEKNLIKKFILKLDAIKAKRLESRLYPFSYKNYFVSPRDAQLAKLISKACCEAIPYGIDLEDFKSQSSLPSEVSPTTKDIIFTGNLDYGPNSQAALFLAQEVMPLVLQNDPKIRLIIAGGNPSESLKSLANSNIVVTGFVKSLAPLIKNSVLYLSPLFYGAGIKNKVLEAMSIGSLVLGSPESFHAIKCTPGFDVLEVNDYTNPNTWSQKIVEIISNQDAYRHMGLNAKNTIEQYHQWEKVKKLYQTEFIG